MFNRKNFLGWLLFVLGGCWKLLEALSTSEFAFKTLWPGKPMKPLLVVIIATPWFPFVLMILGVGWIWWFSRPKKETFISLTKAVEILIEAGKKQKYIKGLGYIYGMQDPDGYYEPFAKLIAQYMPIYGKRPSISFDKWEKISDDMILMGIFRKRASELYLINYIDRGPEFIDLAIKQDDLDKAIQKIMSSDRPFGWLPYEMKED